MFENSPPPLVALVVATVVLAAAVGPVAASAASPASSPPNASFAPKVVYEDRGDVANITVRTADGGVVNVGSPSTAFWMQVQVDGGTTKLRLNTYRAGMAETEAEVAAALSGGTVVRAAPTPVNKPLAAAQYDLNVTRTARNDRELGIGKLVLVERTTRGIEARIAPRAAKLPELTEQSEIRAATQVPWGNGSVARRDWVAVHVNATGLSGMLSKDRLGEDGDDVRLVFERSNPDMNVDVGNRFTGAAVADAEFVPLREGFYVFVDTAEHGIEAGHRYNVSFVVEADGKLADEREVVSTAFEVVPRWIDVERNGPTEKIVVDNETTVTGTTSLTPGTTVNVTARDADLPPIHRSQRVRVTPNRTFAAAFDFSDLRPGREFEFRFPDQEKTVPAAVELAATPTPTETTTPPIANRTTTPNGTTTNGTTPTTAPPTANGTPPTTTSPPTPNTTTTAEGLTQAALNATAAPLTQRAVQSATTEGGGGSVPGFGPVAGVAAVVAAALLVARRR